MKKMDDKELDILLSQYIDGTLSAKEAQKLESMLAMDISARRKVEELKRLKEFLASRQPLTPDVGFWTRFSAALEDAKRDERSLLPFSRRYIPAAAILMTVMLVTFGIIFVENRVGFLKFFHEKTKTVKDAYNKNITQGALLPLFSKVDKDNALQFSLFGTLPLDEKSETGLRVDEQSEKGYRIEVGKDFKRKAKPVTFNHFLAEVKPTKEQKKIIDSLLELTGRRIETSVLICGNNTMVIAPDLPRLNKIMVTNIASCLEPNQRIRFERLLKANDAPYAINSRTLPVSKSSRYFQNIPKYPQDDRFVIITPDTMVYSQLHIDFDSLRRQMEEDLASNRMRRDAMLKRIMSRDFPQVRTNIDSPPPVQVFGGEEFLRIEITSEGDEKEPQQVHVVIRSRDRKPTLIQGNPGRPVQIREWKDTASHNNPF